MKNIKYLQNQITEKILVNSYEIKSSRGENRELKNGEE